MRLIDGKGIAKEIRSELRQWIAEHKKERPPGLLFILVGEDPSSRLYVEMKGRGCREVGIFSKVVALPEEVSQQGLIDQIQHANQDPHIDGLIVQQPLPPNLSLFQVMESVDPQKDVDGFHPINMGRLLIGDVSGLLPCTPLGILTLLKRSHIQVEGREVVVVGRSHIVGKPMAALLMQKGEGRNATVTVAHRASRDLASICYRADILIAAVGSPQLIKKEMVKEGAVVIDVGMNRLSDHRLVGDVDFSEVSEKCSAITPVPGGVGPMTIATLLANTFLSYCRREGIEVEGVKCGLMAGDYSQWDPHYLTNR